MPVIAAAISLRISIHGSVRADDRMLIQLPDIAKEISFSVSDDLKYEEERDYFRSGLNILRRHGHRFSRGFDCVVRGNIPINAGTSSSSALMVSWIHFLSHISDYPVRLSDEDIGKLAYEAEVLEFAEPGGMMDQYTTALGGLIFLESHPQVKIAPLTAPLGDFVLGNSHEQKDTKHILGSVKEEVSAAAKAVRKLDPEFSFHRTGVQALRELEGQMDKRQFQILEGTLLNRDITIRAKGLLQEKRPDHKVIGTLLNEHQAILRDVLHISTPKIDTMIDAALQAGALGAKINGSGGGGCMFAYAPENAEEVAAAVRNIDEATVVQIDKGTHREQRKRTE